MKTFGAHSSINTARTSRVNNTFPPQREYRQKQQIRPEAQNTGPTSKNEDAHIQGRNNSCLRGPQHRLHPKESTHSKGKQNSCLGVHRNRLHHRRALYKTNLPQGPTPPASHMRAPTARVNRTNQPRGHQQRPHVRESIDNKGNQNTCLGANKTDLMKRARA